MRAPIPSRLAVGALVAVLAALSFGVTLPFIQAAGQGVGPFTTAMLLYGGACLAAVAARAVTARAGANLKRGQLGRLVLIALFGAAVAPALLAWGLQRVAGSAGALLLNLEAFFTVVLARAFYRERIGKRVALALSVMLLAGALLGFDAARGAVWSARGALAVTAATLAWAIDNTLTRPLADSDPLAVVAAKAALGATLTGSLAWVAREPWPTQGRALALLACGATGYGVSLTLYLHAQRRIGAARTGSIFALAPFVGAVAAWLLGASEAGALTWISGGLFAVGVALHVTEDHRHWHRHEALEHEHAHRHDDGHHTHAHVPAVAGEHTHSHRHEPVAHDHSHGPDLHHRHDDA